MSNYHQEQRLTTWGKRLLPCNTHFGARVSQSLMRRYFHIGCKKLFLLHMPAKKQEPFISNHNLSLLSVDKFFCKDNLLDFSFIGFIPTSSLWSVMVASGMSASVLRAIRCVLRRKISCVSDLLSNWVGWHHRSLTLPLTGCFFSFSALNVWLIEHPVELGFFNQESTISIFWDSHEKRCKRKCWYSTTIEEV